MLRSGLVSAICVLVVAGCSSDSALRHPDKPNVVVYVIDTLRADRLGLYGYDKATSPNIDALGASGIVFEQASAPAPWTLPSMTSMFLSQLPCEHGVTVDRDRIADGAEPLAVLLKRLGYDTASFHANPYVGKMTGLDTGFDVAELDDDPGALEAAVGTWLDTREGDPFFLYMHTVEPHNPELALERLVEPPGSVSAQTRNEVERVSRAYRALTRVDFDRKRPLGTTDNTQHQRRALVRLDGLREPIDRMYDALVREADERLGRIVASFEDAGLWDDTLFILVSDHGEELGEHGGWQHDQSLYQELVHVPFVLRLPGNASAGRRVSEPVGLVDVVPTVAEILDYELPSDVFGRSLLPLINGQTDRHGLRVIGVRHNEKKYYRPYKEQRGDVNVMMRGRGPWKGIWNAELDTVELYDLDNDPEERTDLSEAEAGISEAMRAFARLKLQDCQGEVAEPGSSLEVELDEETRRQLESLGYVGAGTTR